MSPLRTAVEAAQRTPEAQYSEDRDPKKIPTYD